MNLLKKVLVVEDSTTFRGEILRALKEISVIEVAGVAGHGVEALELLAKIDFDIIISDLEMPVMDGLSLLRELSAKKIESKVIVFSASSMVGAKAAINALSLGAFDFVVKPSWQEGKRPHQQIKESLEPQILALLQAPVKKEIVVSKIPLNWNFFDPDVVVIASSTGGPRALEEFFKAASGNISTPILVTQHMPPVFTASLAESLSKKSGFLCAEAKHGEYLQNGRVYIAPGDFHMSLEKDSGGVKIKLDKGLPRNSVRPCADFLFESASTIYGKKCLGIVLSGMGKDGLDGAVKIKQLHGAILTQTEDTCAVYGMPRAVDEKGCSDRSASPAELGSFVLSILQRRKIS